MIFLCPYCGTNLEKPIINGITSCRNCNRVFDSSPYHRILSAAWLVRRKNVYDCEMLIRHGYTSQEADIVIELVADNKYSHEEFLKIIDERGISKFC